MGFQPLQFCNSLIVIFLYWKALKNSSAYFKKITNDLYSFVRPQKVVRRSQFIVLRIVILMPSTVLS